MRNYAKKLREAGASVTNALHLPLVGLADLPSSFRRSLEWLTDANCASAVKAIRDAIPAGCDDLDLPRDLGEIGGFLEDLAEQIAERPELKGWVMEVLIERNHGGYELSIVGGLTLGEAIDRACKWAEGEEP